MADLFEGLYPKVILSPLSLTVILDAHTRRGERDCLCALVGTLNDDGSLAVCDAVVNFEERGMPQRQHHESFVTARQRVNPRELLLGWASTVGGKLNMSRLHDIAAWARRETKSSRFIPQRRLPTPISVLVTPPTATSDLSVACEIRGPNKLIKQVPLGYSPCFINEFVDQEAIFTAVDNISGALAEGDDVPVDQTLSVAPVARCILKRIDEVLAIAKEAKTEKNEGLGRELMNLVALPGINIPEYLNDERDEAALFDWIKTLSQLQLSLNQRKLAANAAAAV